MTSSSARAGLSLTALTLLGRGVGFVFYAVAAWRFGRSAETDALYLAYAAAVLAMTLAGNAVGAAYGPLFARADSRSQADADGLYGHALRGVLLGSTVASLLLFPLGHQAFHHLTAFTPETAALASRFLPYLLPGLVARSAFQVVRSTLEMRRDFSSAAWAQLARASSSVALLGLMPEDAGIWTLVVALVLPEGLQLAFVIRAAERKRIRPRLSVRPPEVGELGARLLPLLAGEAGVALNFFTDKLFAANLPSGSVTALEYADRIRVIPETLFAQGMVVVWMSDWSILAAGSRVQALRQECTRAILFTLWWGAPLAASVWLLREPAVHLLYDRGSMDGEGLALTAATLGAFAPGLLPQAAGILLARMLAARGKARALMLQGLASAFINTLLNALFMPHFGLPGIALATSVNMFLISIALFILVRLDIGEPLGWRGAGWAASLILLSACWALGLQFAVPPLESRFGAFPTCLFLGGLMMLPPMLGWRKMVLILPSAANPGGR